MPTPPPIQAPPTRTPRPAEAPSGQGPTTAPAAGPGVPLEMLQIQAADLSVQLAGLRAQRSTIENRLRGRNWEQAARPAQVEKLGELNVQIAQGEAKLNNLRAQIADRQGVPLERIGPAGQTLQPPPQNQGRNRGPDPDMVIGMGFALMMAVVLPMSIAFAIRLLRRKPQPPAPHVDEIAPRLDRLEQAVDSIAIEIERISEGQRFVTKIMAERPAPVPVHHRVEGAAPADPSGGLGEGKPFLALGAGPIEPIRMAERQSVRQSIITPH